MSRLGSRAPLVDGLPPDGPGAGELARPSAFWRSLSAEQQRELRAFGLEEVKRRQALRYFTWRWRWATVLRSEQLRFLLGHTSPATLSRCGTAYQDLSDAAWAGVAWPRRDRWLYGVATRLLWEYAHQHDRLRVLALPEPELGSPLPVRWRGRLISQDLANSALEVEAMLRPLGGRAPTSILEVGAGYGRTAYVLLSRFPEARYTIVDIEPALTIARWYLTSQFDPQRLRFLRPDDVGEVDDGSVSLALSISSLQEMRPDQVESYLSLLDRVASGGVVYLKQWRRWHNPVDDLTMTFSQWRAPAGWTPAYRERCPVQTAFDQAAWWVGSGMRS